MEPRGPSAMTIDPNQKAEFLALINKLRAQDTQLIGRLHLIHLGRFREHFEDRWEHLSDCIHGTCRSILKNHALNSHVFYPYEEDSYLVFSYLGSIKDIQHRVDNIGREILTKLLGDEAPRKLMDVSVWGHGPHGHPQFLPLSPAIETPPQNTQSGVELIYRPLLSLENKAISAYLCVPVRELRPVGFSAGYDILNDSNNVYEKAALDLLVLEHAAADSKTLARTKTRSSITIPVHFSTLTQDQKGKEYLQKCRALFGSNTNAISFEIVGLPERLAEYNFGSLVWQLRSITPHINARVTIDRLDFVDLRIAGMKGVCVDLYDDFRNEHQLLERLDRFTSTAHKEGLKTCISGIRTISLNTAAISCGADFVGGYPVSNTTQTIKYMKAFDIQTQYHADIHAA